MIPYVAAAETTGVGLVAAVLLLSGFGKIRHPHCSCSGDCPLWAPTERARLGRQTGGRA
jgi:hypothetical protein